MPLFYEDLQETASFSVIQIKIPPEMLEFLGVPENGIINR